MLRALDEFVIEGILHLKRRTGYIEMGNFKFSNRGFLIKPSSGIKGFQPILPNLVFLSFLLLIISDINLILKTQIASISILSIIFVIFLNLKKYIKSHKDLILTILTINLANISFAIGGILTVIGLRKVLVNKIYTFSRQRRDK